MRISSVGNNAPGPRRSDAGVTLMELIIVLAIMALLASLVGPSFGHWIDDWKLRGAADRLAQTFRYARTRAVYEQRYYVVEMWPEENRIRILEPASNFVREYTVPADIQMGEEKAEPDSKVLRVIVSPSGAVEERTFWVRNRRGTTATIHLDFLLGNAGVEIAKQGS